MNTATTMTHSTITMRRMRRRRRSRFGPRFLLYGFFVLALTYCLVLLVSLSSHNNVALLEEHAKQQADAVYRSFIVDDKNENDDETSYNNYNSINTASRFAQGSAFLLLKAATEPRPVWDEVIDLETERSRCARYNLTLMTSSSNKTKTQTTTKLLQLQRRRIFWGTLIADDSWHALSMIAMEGYGIFHTAAFVESNRTQNFSPRTLRFPTGSKNKFFLQNGGLFGPTASTAAATAANTTTNNNTTTTTITKITVDYFINENKTLKGLEREHAQRALILDRWKANGMTVDDIGYLSDADETFTRDFLRAMQICDVPAFRQTVDTIGNCTATAKVASLSHIVYEASPLCIADEQKKQWFHPDMVRIQLQVQVRVLYIWF